VCLRLSLSLGGICAEGCSRTTANESESKAEWTQTQRHRTSKVKFVQIAAKKKKNESVRVSIVSK
jgi:hypothetical protein